jgi:hypothetical protein
MVLAMKKRMKKRKKKEKESSVYQSCRGKGA